MISDFIVSTFNCTTYLWLGGTEIAQPQGFCLTNLTDNNFKFAKPHASAFLNLNFYLDDMNTDIFLNGETEIQYLYNEGHGFTKKVSFSYPEYPLRGQSAFMDLNYTGLMTHLIPVCLDKTAQTFANCKQIGLMALHEDTKKWFNVLDLEMDSTVNANSRILSFSEVAFFSNDDQLSVPVTLRIGDLNYDGYPDFATILTDINSNKSFAAIYLNLCDCICSNPFRRKFKLSWLSEKVDDVAMVTLFDLYDNGRLNLLLTKRNENNSLQTYAFDYYMESDKYSHYYSFLRVTVVTGRCTDKEGTPQCPKRNDEVQVAFGSNPHGPNACFVDQIKDNPHCRNVPHSCSAQLSQSAHFALQLPFMVFGLGVNTLSVNLNISIANGPNSQRMRAWTEVIPGSKLVIVPYPLGDPDNWDRKLYINMDIYSWVAFVFFFILGLFFTIIIYILHYFEHKEDLEDQMEYKKHWL